MAEEFNEAVGPEFVDVESEEPVISPSPEDPDVVASTPTIQPESVAPVLSSSLETPEAVASIPILEPEVVPVAPSFDTKYLVGASLCVAVLGILLLTLLTRRKLKSRGRALLLVGPSDGGKTAILSSLVYGQPLPSHTSLQTNTALASVDWLQNEVQIIDVPGHPRIRDQFREHLDEAKAIAFVVDANTISRNGAAVAEHLHSTMHALTSLPPSQALPSLAILAHKFDLMKSSSSGGSPDDLAVNRVRSVLERELERRRAAQAGGVGVEGLGDTGDAGMGGLECTGPPSEPFRFANWEAGEIVFIGTSINVGKSEKDQVGGLAALEAWIAEVFS